jgi:hypothetical protein
MFFSEAAAQIGAGVGARVFDAGLLAGCRFVSGRSCDRPARSGFSVVFLGPRADAGLVRGFNITCFTCGPPNGNIESFAQVWIEFRSSVAPLTL